MANVKITELTAATALAGTDVLPIVDVGADATKKVSVSDLLRNLPDGTASAPALAFADDQNTGVLSPGDNSLAFATSGTQRLVIDSAGKFGFGTSTVSTAKFTFNSAGTNEVARFESTDAGAYLSLKDSTSSSINFIEGGADQLSFGTNSNERLRIDSSGRLLVGRTSALNVGAGSAATTEIQNSSGFNLSLISTINSTGAGGIAIGKARGGSVVQSGDDLGSIVFAGHDGTDFETRGASISAQVDGTPGSNDMPGRLVLATTADGASSPTERVRIDSSGKVGIGQSSPNALLEVNSGTAGNEVQRLEGSYSAFGSVVLSNWRRAGGAVAGAFKYNDATTSMSFGTTTSHSLMIRTGDSDRLTIDNSGNVGIGTSSPGSYDSSARNLVVGSASGNQGMTIAAGTSSSSAINFADGTSGTAAYTGRILYQHSADALTFHTDGGSERLRIDSSGRVLIGTSTSPSGGDSHSQNAPLLVQGRIGNDADSGRLNLQRGSSASNGSSIGTISFTDNSNNAYARIEVEADAATGSNDYPGRIKFLTTANGASTPTEHVRIDNAGTTTVWSASAPMVWGRNETSGSVTALAFYNTATSTTSFSGQVFRVMCDGDVENANNSYGAISDVKLKENIVDASSQWDDIKSIQVRNYNFKSETGLHTHTQIGLIAQEVELISPGLVGECIDDNTGETSKTISYSVLYMKAVKALQEAMERIETLETKVAALEAQ